MPNKGSRERFNLRKVKNKFKRSIVKHRSYNKYIGETIILLDVCNVVVAWLKLYIILPLGLATSSILYVPRNVHCNLRQGTRSLVWILDIV